MKRMGLFYFAVAFVLSVPLEAVTVSPSLCPTNKIAPHKRLASWHGTGRTFGAFYDLLAPGNPQYQSPSDLDDLQEQPQEDDPSDCGEIEDYDENDLSSITPQGNRRRGQRGSRGFFIESLFNPTQNYPQRPPQNYPQRPPNYPFPPRPPSQPQRPPSYPQRPPSFPDRPPSFPQRPPSHPQRPPNYPQRPPPTDRPEEPLYATKPPYWSGGFFGSNGYRPPLHQNPSDSIKPIHEDHSGEGQAPYRPNVVGGSLGHVVGVSPIVPTTQGESTTSRTFYNRLRTSTPSTYLTRRPKPRNIDNSSILGSFVDLLFK